MRIALLMCALPLIAQEPLVIPDPNFKSYLISQYDGDGDGEISQAEATEVTGIMDCRNQTISSLEGISNFTGLTGIDCSSNQITELPELSALTELTHLYCNANQLTTLPSLAALSNLRVLNCSSNQLTILPGFSNQESLETLETTYNQFTTLPGISNLTNLTRLSCGGSALTEWPDLSRLIHLRQLYLNGTTLTAVPESISTLTNLTYLNIAGNQLTALPNLSALPNLTELYCETNQLIALPSLNAQTSLEKLNCSNNQLTYMPNLSTLTSMTSLNTSENPLAVQPNLSTLASLTTLNMSNNERTTLPELSGLNNLREVDLSSNQYTEYDCPEILSITMMGLETLIYNPQSDGTELECPCNAPSITTPMASINRCLGSSLRLNAIAYGTAPFTYQWYQGAELLPGETAPHLEISNFRAEDAGMYHCQVGNGCGSLDKDVAEVTVATPITITSEPEPIHATQGDTVTFAVTASGGPISYQWYRDGNLIYGATSQTYTINTARLSDQGEYYCNLQNGCGIETTVTVQLNFMGLTFPPSITGNSENSVEVPVSVQHLAGASFTSFEFTVNNASFELDSRGTLTEAWMVDAYRNNGTTRVVGISVSPIERDGTLLKLRFTGLAAGCTDLELGNILLDTVEIPDGTGQICIAEPCTKGDADGNSQIRAYDAAQVLHMAVGLPTETPIDPHCADTNCDGGVTANDAGLIMKYLIGEIEEFCAPQFQNPTERVQLRMEELCLVGGQRFTLDINTTRIQAADDVIGYQFMLDYDANQLHFEGYETEGSLSQDWAGLVNDRTPGRLIMGAYHSQPLDGEGLLIRLTGTAWQTSGQTELSLEQVILGDGTPAAEVQTATASIEWNERPEESILSVLCPQNEPSSSMTPDVTDINDCDNHQFTLPDNPPKNVRVENNAFIISAGPDLGVETFSYQTTDAGGLMIERNAAIRILDPSYFEEMAAWPATSILGLIEGINQPESTAINK